MFPAFQNPTKHITLRNKKKPAETPKETLCAKRSKKN